MNSAFLVARSQEILEVAPALIAFILGWMIWPALLLRVLPGSWSRPRVAAKILDKGLQSDQDETEESNELVGTAASSLNSAEPQPYLPRSSSRSDVAVNHGLLLLEHYGIFD